MILCAVANACSAATDAVVVVEIVAIFWFDDCKKGLGQKAVCCVWIGGKYVVIYIFYSITFLVFF